LTKCVYNIPTSSIARPSKNYPKWDFWFENKPSGNPDQQHHDGDCLISFLKPLSRNKIRLDSKRVSGREKETEKERARERVGGREREKVKTC
jgi:hypothetical protein